MPLRLLACGPMIGEATIAYLPAPVSDLGFGVCGAPPPVVGAFSDLRSGTCAAGSAGTSAGDFNGSGGGAGLAPAGGAGTRCSDSSFAATTDLSCVICFSRLNQNGAPRLRNSTDAAIPQ